ncbi:glycoside hydrolase family 2 TIM barrel-domain containing protein [Luteolibacter sp. LG18]|uniref:glycoside hydrolase family 2 TIM barrel-domain containing protein n=1 Tax=Luteolibacter sp. LG18 TaxID=2819286 RepID=UPI002B307EFE|nr:beta-galactosidase [Luteolibacter sp. LG18]
MHRSLLLALASSPLLCAAAPDWENPAVFQRNRLPAQATAMPYPDRATALAKARQESPWCQLLNGPWKFHYTGSLEGLPAGFEKPGFDAAAWKDLPVPSNWQMLGYGIPLYSGHTYPFAKNPPKVTDEPPANYTNHPAAARHPVGSYRRTFTLPEDWKDRRTVIAFDGVDSAFDLWINGEKAGYSEDSRTTARFDITALVKPGENTVAVQVHQYSDGSYLESQDTWKLSGIYRDVYLVSSPRIELTDHFLQAGLAADGKGTLALKATVKNHEAAPRKGKVLLELVDAAGNPTALTEATYDLAPGAEAAVPLATGDLNVTPWSAENPALYRYVLMVADDAGKPLACFSGKTGFRTDEVKDGKFLHNGQPVVLKGVIRHDHHLRGGHVMSDADLRAEVLMMKRASLNAVRTGNAPTDPRFLDLCDELGLYVLDEPNLDTDGMQPRNALNDLPEWKEARLARVKNLAERDKNHPSVIAWSVPDDDLVPWLREQGTRPTGSSFFAGDFCTTDGLAYPGDKARPAIIVGTVGRTPGNSRETLAKVLKGAPEIRGGFLASWRDELLFRKPDAAAPRVTLSYGGDFGDQPNAGNACASGIVTVNLGPTPTFEELKKTLQEVSTSLVDGTGAVVKIRVANDRFFKDLGDLKGSWKLLKDGKDIAQGELPPLAIAPRQGQELTISTLAPVEPASEYILRVRYDQKAETAWFPAGMPVAWEEIPLPWGKRTPATPVQSDSTATFTQEGQSIHLKTGDVTATFDRASGQFLSLKRGDTELLLSPLRMDFWRVPTQTDKLLGLDKKSAVWRDAGAKATARKVEVAQAGNDVTLTAFMDIPAGKSTATVTWTFTGTGGISAKVDFKPDPTQPEIPRIGFSCAVPPALAKWTWFGKGPHDNYVDQNRGAWTTIHTGLLANLIHRYPVPQESGNRTDVRWATFDNPGGGHGLRIDATGDSLLEVSALVGTPSSYEAAAHLSDVPKPDRVTLHFDHRQRGLGDPDTASPHPAHVLTADKSYHWSFQLGTTRTEPPPMAPQGSMPRPLPRPPGQPVPGVPPVPPAPPVTPAPPVKPTPASDD